MEDKIRVEDKIRELQEKLLEHFANIVTLAGLYGAILNFVIAIFYPQCLLLMIFVSVGVVFSDWLDGKIAKDKKLGRQSKFGAALDPLRDKVFVVPTLVILTCRHFWVLEKLPLKLIIPTIGLFFMLAFIEAILFIAWWIFLIGKKSQVAIKQWGRRKTFGEFVAVILWLVCLVLEIEYKVPAVQALIWPIIFALIFANIMAYIALREYHKDLLETKSSE